MPCKREKRWFIKVNDEWGKRIWENFREKKMFWKHEEPLKGKGEVRPTMR